MVFPVVWNKGFTLYRSAVIDSRFDFPIDTLYREPDPLHELIEEAHRHGIAVISWFEFRFAASCDAAGGHLLGRKPHGAARDRQGRLLEKNGFVWMNAYHPEVQEFLLALVLEVARNHEVDGIQGDDRLPALPVEGGHSEFSQALYAEEHRGTPPPRSSRRGYVGVQTN